MYVLRQYPFFAFRNFGFSGVVRVLTQSSRFSCLVNAQMNWPCESLVSRFDLARADLFRKTKLFIAI